MKKLATLDLFSGIGGFSLGLERSDGFRTVAFCEIDPFCRLVLAKHWPGVPCYDDVTTLTAARLATDGIIRSVANTNDQGELQQSGADGEKWGRSFHSGIEAICGGFPCQDISVAGRGAGIEGECSGLWSEYARLVGELRPRYVIVENVSALLGRGLDRVLGDLAALGYSSVWHCIPASAVGAPHRRDRIWIIAKRNEYASCKAPDHRSCCIAAAVREREEKFAGDSGATWHDLEACWRGSESRRREDEERARGTWPQAIQSLQNGGDGDCGQTFGQGGGRSPHQSGLEGQQSAEPCRCIEEEAFRFSQAIGAYLSQAIHGWSCDFRSRGGLSDDRAPQGNVGLDGDEGIPASAVGAPHRRDRVWIVAYAGCGDGGEGIRTASRDVANTDRPRLEGWLRELLRECAEQRFAWEGGAFRDAAGEGWDAARSERSCSQGSSGAFREPSRSDWWFAEPDVRGVVDGLSPRLDGGLGGSQGMDTLAGSAVMSEIRLRDLWRQLSTRTSSQGQGSDEQFAAELADAMSDLPHALALAGGQGAMAAASCFLHRLRQACEAVGSVRDASEPTVEAWQSLSDQEAERAFVAACGRTDWRSGEWLGVPRVAQKIPARVDRLRSLGNAIVPQIAEMIGRAIMAAHTKRKAA